MKSEYLLSASSVLQLVTGLAFLFLPQESLSLAGANVDGQFIPVVQALSGGVIGIGYMTWILRRSPFGGIYGRPLLLGNLMFYLVGSLTMLKVGIRGTGDAFVLTAACVLGVFAVGYGWSMYRAPEKSQQ